MRLNLNENEVTADCEYCALHCPRMAASLFKKTGRVIEAPKLTGADGKALDPLARHSVWMDHFIILARELQAAETLAPDEVDHIAALMQENQTLRTAKTDLTTKLADSQAELAALKESTKDAQAAIAHGIAAEVAKLGIRPTALTQPKPGKASAPVSPAAGAGAASGATGADGRPRNADGTINWTAIQTGLEPSPIRHTL